MVCGLNPSRGKGIFSLLQNVQTSNGAFPSPCSVCLEAVLEVKRLGWDVDHLLPSSAKVTNEWSCTCATPVCCHACTGTTLPLPVPNFSVFGLRKYFCSIFFQF